jgi:hypothetical protein
MERKSSYGNIVSWERNLYRNFRELQPLSQWCSAHGINTLFDISKRLPSGSWDGWVLEDLLPHLSPLFQTLFSSLQGCAPHHLSSPDSRGWGSGSYSVHSGYEFLLSNSNLPLRKRSGIEFGTLIVCLR